MGSASEDRFPLREPAQFADRTALVKDDGASLSYDALAEEQRRFAEAVDGRCLIFCLCENRIGSVVGYTACLRFGIVPALLSAHLEREMLTRLMELYHPAYLWVPEEAAAGLEAVHAVYRAYGYVLLGTAYPSHYPMHEKLALLLTTSGSTGSPKFVRQTMENIADNTANIVSYLGLDETEKPITTLPMNYTYGLSIINTHLSVGATVVLTEQSLMQKDFWQVFRGQGVTSFGGVPYTYEMLERLHFTGMELPALRTMTQAGGKLAPALHEKFAAYAQATGKRFVVMYGQCEATARMGYLPPERALDKKGSMGIAIPGGRFVLTDENGSEITESHTTGELVYEGKNVTPGYAVCGEDLMKGDERGGVLRTGDLAQRDEEGYYYIVGRKSRFLKLYGNRVNLDEMDRLLRERFGIDVVCSGTDDHMVLFTEDPDRAEDMRSCAAERTGINIAAFRVVVLDKIPRNDAGKVRYAALSEYL